MNRQRKKWIAAAVEIAHWGAIVLLLLPLFTVQSGRMPLWRMMLGVLLLVLAVGRLFYDYVLDIYKKQAQRSPLRSLAAMVLTITLIAVLIGGLLLMFAFYAVSQLQQGGE